MQIRSFNILAGVITVLTALPCAAADERDCHEVISKELSLRGLGTYDNPKTDKTWLSLSSSDYLKKHEQVNKEIFEELGRLLNSHSIKDIKISPTNKRGDQLNKEYFPAHVVQDLIEQKRFFDHVLRFGSKDVPALIVYLKDKRVLGFYSSRPNHAPKFVSLTWPECKTPLVRIFRERGSPNHEIKLTPSLCRALPSQKEHFGKFIDDYSTEFKQHCEEQGGTFKYHGKLNWPLCICSTKGSINPLIQSCAKDRRPHKLTDRDRFMTFIKSHGGSLGVWPKIAAIETAMEACQEFSGHFVENINSSDSVVKPNTDTVTSKSIRVE
jgi:hypothetical protein